MIARALPRSPQVLARCAAGLVAGAALAVGCFAPRVGAGSDGGPGDGGEDRRDGEDAPPDADGGDGAPDAPPDVGDADAPPDAPDDGADADAPVDLDAADAPPDAPPDGADADAPDDGADGGDAGPPPPAPALRFPWNGFATGSAHAPSVGGRSPLRPTVRWDPVPGAASYDVQLDDSCAGASFSSCSFPSPAVDERASDTLFVSPVLPISTVQPVGRRYYVRVRACSAGGACSAWTPVRYVDVGRQRTDFNGDGYADVMAGAPGDDIEGPPFVGGVGAASVAYGHAAGGSAAVLRLRPPDEEAFAAFGTAVAALGDVNGDGYADAAISAPGIDAAADGVREGSVWVYAGSASGLRLTPIAVVSHPGGGLTSNVLFGSAVAGADFDGDGYADLAVGAPGAETGAGHVLWYRGSAFGVASTGHALAASEAQVGAEFGYAVAAGGDVNGDGFADLVATSPFLDVAGADVGRAEVYLGGAAGLASAASISIESPHGESIAFFGMAASARGDVNDDGYTDLVVSAPFTALPSGGGGVDLDQAGEAYLFRGGASGPAAAPDATLRATTPVGYAKFGRALDLVRDVNGDGFDDVLVGAEDDALSPPAQTGVAYLFFGDGAGVLGGPVQAFESVAREGGASFGFGVAGALDRDGDGYGDLVIGSFSASVGGGARPGVVFLVPGSASGADTAAMEAWEDPEAGDGAQLGSSVD